MKMQIEKSWHNQASRCVEGGGVADCEISSNIGDALTVDEDVEQFMLASKTCVSNDKAHCPNLPRSEGLIQRRILPMLGGPSGKAPNHAACKATPAWKRNLHEVQ